MNAPIIGITGLEAIGAAGSLAALIGLPIAAWAIVHEGRELRRELFKRAQLQFSLSGVGLARESVIPSPASKRRPKRDPQSTDSVDCEVLPDWQMQAAISEPVVVNLISTNFGERSAHKLVWNYTVPRTLLSEDTLRSLRSTDIDLQPGSVRLYSSADSLHPGTSHQVQLPPLSFPRRAERATYEVRVTVSQEDHPPRSVVFRLLCAAEAPS